MGSGHEPTRGAAYRMEAFLMLASCRTAGHDAGMAGRVRPAIRSCGNLVQ